MAPSVTPGAAMRWAAASSTDADSRGATSALCDQLAEGLGDGPADLVLFFFGGAHMAAAEQISEALRARFQPNCLIGTSAAGAVSTGAEHESSSAITAIGARLPGVTLSPFILAADLWREVPTEASEFAQLAPGALGSELLVMLGDPFSLPMDRVIAAFQRHAPGLRIVGGMASAGAKPKTNRLILNDWADASGGVGLALSGAIRADVIVSQGCRPVGPALEVTHAEGHVIFELDGQPALERTEQVLRALPEASRERLAQGLYIGRPARGGASGAGDYLIRNLLGADRDRGALAVGDHINDREKIRLHVRDGEAATEDLEMLLAPQEFDARAAAALVFLCNGRGKGLYGRANGDITTLQQALGGVPAAGMFCAGEIGPVGNRNFLHGHTASIAILRPA